MLTKPYAVAHMLWQQSCVHHTLSAGNALQKTEEYQSAKLCLLNMRLWTRTELKLTQKMY